MDKHSKVSCFTKCRLGENVVLRLIECLTSSVSSEIFMDSYFTTFRLLTHLGVNNIQATRVLDKNRLCKETILGDKQPQRNVAILNSAHQAKKQCNLLTVVG